MADPVAVLAAELAAVAGTAVELDRPSDPGHGDYASNVAMRLAGSQGRAPRAVAEELAPRMAAVAGVERVDVAGPGFLNLRLEDGWFAGVVARALEEGERFGGGSAAARERVQVEMVSANPTGPITVASARNGAYGDSVARLLAFAGHEVEREYYYNDSGSQMDAFRASVDAARRGDDPPEDGYHGAYVAELAGVPGDPVPRMLEQIEASLERFRIHFDSFERQSAVELEIPEAVALLDTLRAGRGLVGAHVGARRREGPGTRAQRRDAHVLRRRRGLRAPEVRQGLRQARLRARRRPPRVRRPSAGAGGDARTPA